MKPNLRPAVERGTSLCAALALLYVGLDTGTDIWTLAFATDILFVRASAPGGFVSVGVFSLAVVVVGLFYNYDIWVGGPSTDPVTAGPPVEAIVPAYRDAAVVERSVEALLANDYDPLRVSVVVEPDDDRTRARAEELAAEYDDVQCLVNGDPGSKAGAINSTVRRSDADYFVVFDADEEPMESFVSTAMGELTGDTDVFQGRRVPRATGAVETLAYCERVIVQSGYRVGELAGFTHCQSSSTAFTREAFEATGGYADVLTEDIYFSHQCHEADLAVTRNRNCTSTMEAPHTIRDLWGQRKRWRIGHVQVSHVRLREELSGDVGLDTAVSVGRSLGAVVAGGVFLLITAHVLFLALVNVGSALLPFASTVGTIGGVWAYDAKAGTVGLPSWGIVLAPLVYLGHGLLTIKAISEYALTWEGEWYQVSKAGA